MPLKVNTNLEALNINRNLNMTNKKVSDSLKRISSGLRIQSAKDDAAGLAVANSFEAKISSLRVAYQNATESNAMLQTADGAYNKVHDILIRMKDLATQAAGGQIEDSNRNQLDTEFKQLQSELDRIAESTKYGGQTLVYASSSGKAATFTFQIGATNASTDQIAVELDAVSTAALGVNGLGVSSSAAAASAMASIDVALTSVNNFMANLGAYQNRLQYTMENLETMIENFSTAESAIRDADMASEVTTFTKNQILQQTGMAMLAQANTAPQQILSLLK